ncbi:hypothetical protein [Sporomusa sp. GT1]|uniref:hypothetical protein n=1 Tax=Sporomusa sp. GT1 TaxID=1534747 RepID=UPI001CB85DB7|nr:hypothetical protein [Sporomusa sp. GT1]
MNYFANKSIFCFSAIWNGFPAKFKENTTCAEPLAGRIAMPSMAQSALAPSRRVAAEVDVALILRLRKLCFLLGEQVNLLIDSPAWLDLIMTQ